MSHNTYPGDQNRVVFDLDTLALFAAASHSKLDPHFEELLLERLPHGLTHEEIDTFATQHYNIANSIHLFRPELDQDDGYGFKLGESNSADMERRALDWLAAKSLARGDIQTADFTVHILREKKGIKYAWTAAKLDRKVGRAKLEAQTALAS